MELEDADAAHSMVMMAQGEVDAAQSAVDTTVAMMERGTQIATNVKEANNLAAAVRGASGARTATGSGFDQVTSESGTANTVTITRRGPNSSPAWTLNDGSDTTGAGVDLADYSDEYVVSYDSSKKAVKEDVPAPQSITGWFGKQFWAFNEGSKATDVSDDMETGRVVVYTNIGPGDHVRLGAGTATAVQGVDSIDGTTYVVSLATNQATAAAKLGAFGVGLSDSAGDIQAVPRCR